MWRGSCSTCRGAVQGSSRAYARSKQTHVPPPGEAESRATHPPWVRRSVVARRGVGGLVPDHPPGGQAGRAEVEGAAGCVSSAAALALAQRPFACAAEQRPGGLGSTGGAAVHDERRQGKASRRVAPSPHRNRRPPNDGPSTVPLRCPQGEKGRHMGTVWMGRSGQGQTGGWGRPPRSRPRHPEPPQRRKIILFGVKMRKKN
jgi:hypothetical protein